MRPKGKTILLSAYACEPNRGSEPGIGWNWAVELTALGHEVWVLTQPEHAPAIARALEQAPMDRLHVRYVGVPGLDHWSRMPGRLSSVCYLLHVFVWQWLAYLEARALTRRIRFDLVHHLTMGSIRVPCWMGQLGIPFLYGPVAGGDCPPKALRASFPAKARRYEALRDLANLWIRLDPLLQQTFRRATAILTATPQTRQLLPRCYQGKATVQLAIGTPPVTTEHGPRQRPPGELRLMFAGRLLSWKGLHLALRALSELRREVPGASLTVIGSGPDEAWLKGLAAELGLEGAVDWIPWLPQEEVLKAYARHDVFLFPSMRDSGGMVVLEALGNGLPVICLDLGGPGAIVDATCGRIVPTHGKGEREIVTGLHSALASLARDPDRLKQLSAGARARAEQFTWRRLVRHTYDALWRSLESSGPSWSDGVASAR
ncbi:MAG TPA: glycosyltransferase family 4 protein [Stenomitos sp.]